MDYSALLSAISLSDALLAIGGAAALMVLPWVVKWACECLSSMFARSDPDEAGDADAEPEFDLSDSVCGYCGAQECWGECRDSGA